MNSEIIIGNLFQPVILFFFLGLLASVLKSDLEIPQPLPKLFSLYLLIAIGLHGGYEISKSGIDHYVLKTLIAAMSLAFIVPIYAFFILLRKVDVYNAAGIAATYGSISAVTFITATNFLQTLNTEYGGHMVASMALMESPAIVIGLILASLFSKNNSGVQLEFRELARESLLNGSVFLLMGSLFIGFVTKENGWKAMEPVYGDLFKGLLAFFLLDMGLVTGKRLYEIKRVGSFLAIFGIIFPVFNAIIAIIIARLLLLTKGDAFLLSVLAASASYIAVPASLRISLPEASPGLYVTMSLAVTFPFNIIFGIPLYYYVVNSLW
jgi:hypothetical protein